MCTNEIEYATNTTFMYPRCERARLSGYTIFTMCRLVPDFATGLGSLLGLAIAKWP